MSLESGIKQGDPLISVIAPVYNNSRYLEECINSLLGQTLRDIEIIVIDDGSTDPETVRILEEVRNADPRIILISKKNRGYGHSVNLGLNMASGLYAGIVESDDYVHADMYRILAEIALKTNADVVKARHAYFTDSEDGRNFISGAAIKNGGYVTEYNSKNLRDYMRGHLINPNGIFRMAFLNASGIRFNETPGASFQDIGFFCKTALLAKTISIVDEQLYFVRRDNAASSVYDKGKTLCAVDEYNETRAFFEGRNIPREQWIGYITYRKFKSFSYTLKRIDDKYRGYFKEIFIRDWARALDNNEIDYSLFDRDELDWIKTNLEIDLAPSRSNTRSDSNLI